MCMLYGMLGFLFQNETICLVDFVNALPTTRRIHKSRFTYGNYSDYEKLEDVKHVF
jgi:hypothetical protein